MALPRRSLGWDQVWLGFPDERALLGWKARRTAFVTQLLLRSLPTARLAVRRGSGAIPAPVDPESTGLCSRRGQLFPQDVFLFFKWAVVRK